MLTKMEFGQDHHLETLQLCSLEMCCLDLYEYNL